MRYLVLIGLIVGGLLGYYVLWSHLADQMMARADAWIEVQRQQGRDVGYASRQMWGFPYRLSLTLKQPHWSDPRLPMAPRIEAEEITAHLQLWSLEHVIFELSGNQTIAWQDNGVARKATLTSERFRASLVNDGAGNWLRIAADLSVPRLQGPPEGLLRDELTAEKLLFHVRRADNVPPSADIALQLDKLTLPPRAESPLGRLLHSLRLTGNLRGSFYGTGAEDMLSTWRDSGGVLDLSTIAFTWGGLQFSGNGSLTVDRNFRPLGAMSGIATNGELGVEALKATGLVDPKQVEAVRRFVQQIPERIEKGIPLRDMALTAQDGKLSLGEVPLLSLPSVLPGR